MTDKSFEFDSVGLAQVLANNTLKIPAHQRDYAWTKDEVGRLLTDLAAAKGGLKVWTSNTLHVEKRNLGAGGVNRLPHVHIICLSQRVALRQAGHGIASLAAAR